jgi:hypothetical protein
MIFFTISFNFSTVLIINKKYKKLLNFIYEVVKVTFIGLTANPLFTSLQLNP